MQFVTLAVLRYPTHDVGTGGQIFQWFKHGSIVPQPQWRLRPVPVTMDPALMGLSSDFLAALIMPRLVARMGSG